MIFLIDEFKKKFFSHSPENCEQFFDIARSCFFFNSQIHKKFSEYFYTICTEINILFKPLKGNLLQTRHTPYQRIDISFVDQKNIRIEIELTEFQSILSFLFLQTQWSSTISSLEQIPSSLYQAMSSTSFPIDLTFPQLEKSDYPIQLDKIINYKRYMFHKNRVFDSEPTSPPEEEDDEDEECDSISTTSNDSCLSNYLTLQEKSSTILLPLLDSIECTIKDKEPLQTSIHPYHLSAILFYIANRTSSVHVLTIYDWCKRHLEGTDYREDNYFTELHFLEEAIRHNLVEWMRHLRWILQDEVIKPSTSQEVVDRYNYKSRVLEPEMIKELEKIYLFFKDIQHIMYKNKSLTRSIGSGKLERIVRTDTDSQVSFRFHNEGISALDIWQSIRILCIRFGFESKDFILDLEKRTVIMSAETRRILDNSVIPFLCSMPKFISRGGNPCMVYPLHQNSFYQDVGTELTVERKTRMLFSLKSLCKFFDRSRSMEAWPDPKSAGDAYYFKHYTRLPLIMEFFTDEQELLKYMKEPLNSMDHLWVSDRVNKRGHAFLKFPTTKICGLNQDRFNIYSAIKSFCYVKSQHGIPRQTLSNIARFFETAEPAIVNKHRMMNNLTMFLCNSPQSNSKDMARIPLNYFKKTGDHDLFPHPTHLLFYEFMLCPEVPTYLALDIFFTLHVLNPHLEPVHLPVHHEGLDVVQSAEFREVISTGNQQKRKAVDDPQAESERKRRKMNKERPSKIMSQCTMHADDPMHIPPKNRLIDDLFRFTEEMFYHPARIDPKEAQSTYRGRYDKNSHYGGYKDYVWEDSNVPIQWDKKSKTLFYARDLFPIWSSELKSQETCSVPPIDMSRQGRSKYKQRIKKQDEELGPFVGSLRSFLETIVLSPALFFRIE